jgi:hypothetical protein
MLAKASNEQLNIINAIKSYNVKVNSVAGSGKTTTVLHMAQILDNESILLLTYNARLKIETRKKKNDLELNNLDVDSYHSFCVGHYDRKCFKDSGIINLLKKNTKPLKKINYSIIVVDEAQDMNKLYYKLVNKIINDNQRDCRICIIGDRYQSIYQFNCADHRFITLADQIFKPNDLEWKELKLSVSFRITNQMADFINHCVMGFNYITANKTGNKVRYIMTETFNYDRPLAEVIEYLKDCHYDDIFILAPSIKKGKNDSPVRVLANALTKFDIPIHVPTDDDAKLDEDVIKNKVVFSTFHQAKGLERKNVIVYCFDESYFQIFNKNADPNFCPNEIYVAITRASENLTILHNTQKNYLPFLNDDLLSKYAYYEKSNLRTVYEGGKTITLDVSEVTKHLPSDVVNNALDFFEKVEIRKSKTDKFIDIPIKTKQGNLYEPVADINGIVIPAYFEYVNNKKMSIYDILINKNQVVDIKLDLDMPTSDLLKLATQYSAFSSGYMYKLKQIKDYNWMDDEKFDNAVDRLELVIDKNAKFEVEVYNPELKMGKVVVGRMDCLDKDTIWEFKCTRELQADHFIQLAIYALLHENMREVRIREMDKKIKQMELEVNRGDVLERVPFKRIELGNILLANNKQWIVYKLDEDGVQIRDDEGNKRRIRESNTSIPRLTKRVDQKEIDKLRENKKFFEDIKFKYKLMNILSNEIYEIKFTKEKLDEMLNYLLYHKYKGVKKLTDEEFIDEVLTEEINLEMIVTEVINETNEIKETSAFLD